MLSRYKALTQREIKGKIQAMNWCCFSEWFLVFDEGLIECYVEVYYKAKFDPYLNMIDVEEH